MECPKCHHRFAVKKKAVSATTANGRRGRPAAASSNGRADVRTILTIQSLLKTNGASDLKKIVDEVANAGVPF
jgi:hypothetical protein